MGTIADRLLETDLRRIQLTIWPFATAAAIAWKDETAPPSIDIRSDFAVDPAARERFPLVASVRREPPR
jgi:hypothetical protein